MNNLKFCAPQCQQWRHKGTTMMKRMVSTITTVLTNTVQAQQQATNMHLPVHHSPTFSLLSLRLQNNHHPDTICLPPCCFKISFRSNTKNRVIFVDCTLAFKWYDQRKQESELQLCSHVSWRWLSLAVVKSHKQVPMMSLGLGKKFAGGSPPLHPFSLLSRLIAWSLG